MLHKLAVTASGLVLATGALLASTPVSAAAQPPVPATPSALPGTIGVAVELLLGEDGRLSVTETAQVPEGVNARRKIALRQVVGDDVDRVFRVSDLVAEGSATAQLTAEDIDIQLKPGASTVKYTVDGAVADIGDQQEVRWQASGGWDRDVDSVTIDFAGTDLPKSITCLAGPVGSSAGCTQSQIRVSAGTSAKQVGLKAGERVDLTIGLAPGTVPATARFEESFSVAKAFALTPVTAAALGGLALLLVGGVGLLLFARGRDAKALAGDVGPVEVLVADDQGRISFASPDGVLPGQVGTVVDEHVDVVDITATVIDLAVRNYLWVEENSDGNGGVNWRIVRRNPADDYLTDYERALYDSLFAGDQGRDEVLLSDLRGVGLDLGSVSSALYADVVTRSWFKRRPDTERTRWWWIGLGLTAAGVAATALLAFTTTYAVLGLAVVVAGIALAIGARWMPARTRRGSALIEQVRGLRGYLHSVAVDDIPAQDRELVFSRSLPYAVVLGETDRWLRAFAGLDADADGTPGLYWYGEAHDGANDSPDLRRFAAHFPLFLAAVDGVLAEAGHLRALRT